MEESKELQGTYTLFRVTIYVSLLLEFFMFALDPTALDFLGGVITNVHSRLGRLSMYQLICVGNTPINCIYICLDER